MPVRPSRWVANHLDKALFFAVVVVGGVTILAVDQVNGSKWVAVTICSLLMFTYAILSFVLPGMKLRPDQAGDNLYYQGLLFTLISLGAALLRFSGAGATDSILRNFGIAIFTTIVGLALRVMIGQFREDPEDLEHEARIALSQSVKRMRGELDLSVAELRSFADGMKQVVGDFTTSANKSTTQALERAVSRFEKATEAMGARLETTATTFQARSAAFEQALTATVAALEGLTARVAAVRADETMVDSALRPALDVITTAIRQFAAAVAEQRESFDAGAASVRQFAESGPRLSGAGEALEAAVERLTAAAAMMERAAEHVARFDAASSSAADATERFTGQLDTLATATANQNAEAVRIVQKAAEEAVSATGAQADRQLRALNEVVQQVSNTLAGLDREFAGSGETIERVRRELTELAGWIIARLDRP